MKQRSGDVVCSMLYYRPFDAWAPQSEWTQQMPEGESVECVAVGASWVAVATSQRRLRIFTSSGLETHISMISGPVRPYSGTNATHFGRGRR